MSDQGKSSNMPDSENRPRHFCDAVIAVGGVEFHVHKFILCRCCSYFRNLFICLSAPDKKVFEIPDLSAEMTELIIEFAYKGTVSVTDDNVQQLLQAADRLNITDIVQMCCNFLVEKLSIKNCIGIWQLTNICICPELGQKTFHFVITHFEEVVSSEEFQQLSAQELIYILGRDKLNVSQESTVYEAIVKWIAHAPEERNRHFAALLSKVRLALTSLEYIRSVSSTALVRSDNKCKNIVKHARLLNRSLSLTRPAFSTLPNFACPRIPNAILLAIGGRNNSGLANVIEAYDIRTNRWKMLTHAGPCAYNGTAIYNGSVYCVGGLDGEGSSNTVCRFDLQTRTWHEAAPMYEPRLCVAVTVLNGYIYAIGGREGSRRLKSAERYKPETNQWTYIASTNDQRCDAGCTVLNNKIYICGGYDEDNCLDTCEYYTPETDQWTMFASMSIPRRGTGVVAYANQIFAVGGYNYIQHDIQHLMEVEAYSPQTNTWREVASMSTGRRNFGIEVIENKLFAVGGYNALSFFDMVECYDANTNTWSAASHLGFARSGLSCCVVSDLPNVEEYIFPRSTLP